GASVSGAGVYTENRINTAIKAFDDTTSIPTLKDLTLTATDSSTITADAGAASLAVGVGSSMGVGVSLGISLAFNEVDNDVATFIRDAGTINATGDITLDAKVLSDTTDTSDYGTDSGTTTLVAGNTVQLADDYAVGGEAGRIYAYRGFTADFLADAGTQLVHEGNTVQLADDSVYRYTGDDAELDLSAETYASSTELWTLVHPDSMDLGAQDYSDTSRWELADATISARAAAASIAAAFGSSSGISVSGAGAVSTNTILTKTNAFIENSTITKAVNVDLSADNAASISAIVVAASVSVGAGSSNGVGASIGLSFAMNQIGWDGLTETPSEVQAYISNSRVNASGNLSLSADGNEKIDAITLAGSAAVAVGGSAGVGVSGAGVTSINRISTNIGAYIDGDQAAGSAVAGIDATAVTLTAKDTSAINSIAGAASVAAAFGGSEGVAVSIGVALAENHIGNQIDAYIANVAMPTTDSVGNITVRAENSAVINAVCAAASIAMSGGGSAGVAVSGAGAVADNTILTSTEAYVNNSTLVSSGSIDLEALSTSEINAVVVAASAAASGGGTAGVGASVGASLVRNLIGWDASSAAADFTTDDDLVHLTTGNTVKVVGGVRDGDVYEYLGDEVTRYTFTSDGGTQSVSTDDLVNVPSDYSGGTGAGGIYKYTGSETTSLDLSSQDYTGDDWELTGTNAIDFGDSGNWKLVLADDIDDAALVRARIVNSDVTAAGDLTLNAEANETINSTAVAGSVAIGGAGTVGVAVSGTGVGTGNWVRTFVDASIDGNSGAGTSSHEIHARNIILDASDNATITTNAIGASIAGSGGGVAGVSVTIGMSASINEVSNEVEAFIQNVAEVEATGDITLNASVAPASSTTADHGTGESSVALTAGDTV
ncbi:MAG: hypothetical protein WCR76_10845, partial [Sphaerochaetaceae bacterium]